MGIISDIYGLAKDTVSLTVETARFGINTVRDCVKIEPTKKRKPRAKKSTAAKKAVADK